METSIKSQETKNNSSTTKLSPFVYWAQTEQNITLKLDLRDAEEPKVHCTPKTITCSSKGYGARGLNVYNFDLTFYDSVAEEDCVYHLYDSKIEISIKKKQTAWWPRLVSTPQKPHWLKIDFERWQTEDDGLENEKPRNIIDDYAKEYEKLQKDEIGYIKEGTKKVYLIFYNLAQFIGFLYIASVMGILYYRDGLGCIPKIYESVGNAIKFCQLLQYLEVLHPIFGYTKGGPVVPFFQISARNFILFIMIEMEERMQTKPVVFYLFCMWTAIELVRYPFYIMQLVKKDIGLLTWLRYTLWIPLYPLGILCEGIVILRNIPYFEETQRFSVSMPNTWNSTFNMPLFMKIYLLFLTLPGTYLVMTHMAKLRAKKLAGKRRRRHID